MLPSALSVSSLDVRKFGPKSDKIWAHRGAFIYQEPFKKDSSTASRVINEVVLGTGVKIALAAAYFHGFGVARRGPWVTSVNKPPADVPHPSSGWHHVYGA